MVDLFDSIPVDYSLLWKHSHPTLIAENKPATPPTISHKYDTIFPQHLKLSQNSSASEYFNNSSEVHSNPNCTAPGCVQHPTQFSVSTATHTQLGKSDIDLHSRVTPIYFLPSFLSLLPYFLHSFCFC